MSAAQPTLALDVVGQPVARPPVPTRPTLIRTLPQKPLQLDSLDALARHIHGVRGQRGLRIGNVQHASHGGSDTFPGFPIYAIDPDTQGEEWLGWAAVQSATPEALKAALRQVVP
jgi:hypothetical protein